MRRVMMIAGFVLLVAAALAVAGDEAPWFDMENCEMCKLWASPPEMMAQMTCEQHKIDNGMMSITNVAPEYMEAYRAANKSAEELGAKLMSGYEAHLCGYCQAIGQAMAHGAKMENIATQTGSIFMLTSADPKVVDEIHVMTDRTDAEMKKMMGEMDDHEEQD